MENTKLSNHFTLDEFLNVSKYPDNKPTMQHMVNMTYGCLMLLEPARQVIDVGFEPHRVTGTV